MICKCCRQNIGKTTVNNTTKVEKKDTRAGRKGETYFRTIRICPICGYENILKRTN